MFSWRAGRFYYSLEILQGGLRRNIIRSYCIFTVNFSIFVHEKPVSQIRILIQIRMHPK